MEKTSFPVIKVTFKDHYPAELVDLMWETEFVGLSGTFRREGQRVLYLQPLPDQYQDLKAQLEELEREGALSFIEEFS